MKHHSPALAIKCQTTVAMSGEVAESIIENNITAYIAKCCYHLFAPGRYSNCQAFAGDMSDGCVSLVFLGLNVS